MQKLLVNPWNIEPPHAPNCEAEVDQLARSMKARGWSGRPLIAFQLTRAEAKQFNRSYNKYQSLTGSHRTAAARIILYKVPVIILGPRAKQAVLEYWADCDPFCRFFPDPLADAFWQKNCRALSVLVSEG